jgi:hypothetical protein
MVTGDGKSAMFGIPLVVLLKMEFPTSNPDLPYCAKPIRIVVTQPRVLLQTYSCGQSKLTKPNIGRTRIFRAKWTSDSDSATLKTSEKQHLKFFP